MPTSYVALDHDGFCRFLPNSVLTENPIWRYVIWAVGNVDKSIDFFFVPEGNDALFKSYRRKCASEDIALFIHNLGTRRT